MKTGRRVGVVSHIDEKTKTAYLYGYGFYLGFFRPDERPDVPRPAGYFAALRTNDCYDALIKLDSGQYVWGCECWWGGEINIKKRLKQYVRVETLDIEKERKKAPRVNFLRRKS